MKHRKTDAPACILCIDAMLRRQRTILTLLSTVGGSLATTQLQKFLFLLKQETFLHSDSVFYEFLPYKFGPYSFAANREVEALVAYGYAKESSSGTSKVLSISPLGRREARHEAANTARAIRAILSKYGQMSLRRLMKDIYCRYPWYSTQSEVRDLLGEAAPTLITAPIAVYTIGYETYSVDSFFDRLLRIGIRRVIDVRSNPVSRKFGFARSSMSSIAGKLGLDYSHRPALGIPSAKRRGVESSAEFRQLFGYYERQILTAKRDEINEVAGLMKETPSVLVCVEKEPVDCHRSRLATQVAADSCLKIVHL